MSLRKISQCQDALVWRTSVDDANDNSVEIRKEMVIEHGLTVSMDTIRLSLDVTGSCVPVASNNLSSEADIRKCV